MVYQGRPLARLMIALGLLVLGIAGYASRDILLERRYLWKLESEDKDTRLRSSASCDRRRQCPSFFLSCEIGRRTSSRCHAITYGSFRRGFLGRLT